MELKVMFVLIIVLIISGCGEDSITNIESTQISKSNLALYLSFNGNLVDESGNNNQVISTDATLTKDRFGNNNAACLFDGVNKHLVITDSDLLSPVNDSLSISLWTNINYNKNTFLLYKGSTPYNREYAMGIRPDSLFSFQINSDVRFQINDSVRSGITSGEIVEEGKWTHIVGTWDGHVQKLYINGTLVNIDYPQISISNLESDLYIGSYGGSILEYAFNGALDDVLIFTRCITESEINILYENIVSFK